MESSLFINDREYISVSMAADLVGHSEAYINQLIQGKWVAASYVHGRHYVDVEALVRFMRMLEEEQAHDKTVNANKDEKIETAGIESSWLMISKTGVVVLTGLLLGVIIWTMQNGDVTLAALRESLMASTAMLMQIFTW